ncbi:MAG: carboxypeptidase-like regulatory domain-containing protein [Acidobacteriota bacterium]|nr:carboxypeptidase-like regulatory domain-containing protein [Acidobacteriota bacterium]
MRARLIASLVISAVTFLAAPASAQDGVIFGSAVDSTKASLPGVAVTATLIDTGRVYSTVTDERGEYRLRGLEAGRYKVQAELSGFSTVVVPDIELLVGQNRMLPFAMQVASLSETLTVTGESPLVDISSTQVSGNVDRRQMEELPLQGRNWMELAMQVKGITANAVDTTPGVRDRQFQLNLDGQEITQQVAGSGFGQPKFSREAIAEFQVVTNLFDITQGRSLGIQVQAISRSGTNNYDGSVYGYFRDDKWNAKDFIANRVLPYANQQLGGAFGGPVVKDKAHFFASFERENEPNTIITSPAALPGQTFSFDTKLVQNSFLGRGDWQARPTDHLTARASYWDWGNPFTQVSGSEHPSQAASRYRKAINVVGTWSKVLSNTTLQEVKVGYTHFDWQNLLAIPALANTPNYVFPGLTVGQRRNYPQEFFQNTISARYDLTKSWGRHDSKFGGEYLRWHDTGQWQLLSKGEFIFTAAPADLNRRFPASAWNDPSKWDVTGLDATVQRFDQNFGDWTIDIPRPTWAVWFGDTWRIADSFTVNYGVRWDADWGALDPPHITTQTKFNPVGGPPYPDIDLGPGDLLYPNNLRDIGSVAPRGGFTWNVGGDGNFVIRGGSGLYYSIPDSNTTFSIQSFNGERILVNSFPNDGQPGFLADPTRGRTPQDFLSGRFPLPAQSPRVIAHDYQMPSTWQSIIGFQKSIGTQLGVEADLTHWKGYHFARQRDPNMFFNPATGYNRNPAQGRPDPAYTQIQWLESSGHADYSALSTGINRRYRNNWQAGLTYTLMLFMNDDTTGFQYQGNNPFQPDAEWARSTDFQRHTVRLNGIWRLPYDLSLSGAYLFGSGNYYNTTYAANPFGGTGTNRYVTAPLTVTAPASTPDSLDRFDGKSTYAVGEIVPRNALVGKPLHRMDMRLSKDINLPAGIKLTGIAEVFNLTNHKNFGAYNAQLNSTTFGQPRQNLLNAYQPRVMQLAFKVSF